MRKRFVVQVPRSRCKLTTSSKPDFLPGAGQLEIVDEQRFPTKLSGIGCFERYHPLPGMVDLWTFRPIYPCMTGASVESGRSHGRRGREQTVNQMAVGQPGQSGNADAIEPNPV